MLHCPLTPFFACSVSWAYGLLSEAAINWQDKLLSGKVINISRVIKLSLSSHDNVLVNDPLALCLSFFVWVALKRGMIANKQLLCGGGSLFQTVSAS